MYYFIGIKGTGMASLAIMLNDLGHEVKGSDLDKHFFTEDLLREKGIEILNFNPENIKEEYTVIIGNAFLEDFPEVMAARAKCTCYRYHEFLGVLMRDYKAVSIAGSHGKTTTTTMCKSVFEKFAKTGYLIGDGQGHLEKDSEYLCVESDEFRNHFHEYYPEDAIITNIEIDHVDFFKDEDDYFASYQKFVDQVKENVLYFGDDKWCKKLSITNKNGYSFGIEETNDFYPRDLKESAKGVEYDLIYKGQFLKHFVLPFVGRHLVIDSLGVIALAYIKGFDLEMVEEALSDYHGPKRRYVIEEYRNSIFVDDYAHHPTEVKVTLEATKLRYPDKKIIAIFKPHRASRVLHFANEFKEALLKADKIYLLDFTSIDDKQDGTDIDINYLSNMIDGSIVLSEDEEGAKMLAENGDAVYVFMSSKDIYNIAGWTKKYL
ncbi:MAG: Mur ligase family protein [Erysipelotrichaceae bacterium]|nr:Mur ligase family protein [Erysipelotrichaceae bacterium]